MTDSFAKITINDRQIAAGLKALELRLSDLTPAMRAIAGALARETERNFSLQGRPKWAALRNPPERRRGGMILQDTGRLAASVTTRVEPRRAIIGSNAVYAAIHQFGGTIRQPARQQFARFKGNRFAKLGRKDGKIGARRGTRIGVLNIGERAFEMPARPFLPVEPDGTLQPAARGSVLDAVLRHMRTAAR